MTGLPAMLAAQVAAELRTRLRSAGTVVAAVALFVAAFAWIPDPASNVTSVTWTSAGHRVSGTYTADFVGLVAAALSCFFLGLLGFYLVVGSVRRDRERGVGAILAATPLSKTAYVLATFTAHVAYLLVLGGLALAAGFAAFLRYGSGPWSVGGFLWPALLLTPPSVAFTAALAVAFEMLPVLRGRIGLVLYPFVWSICVTMPLLARGDLGRSEAAFPDPVGVAAVTQMVTSTVPSAERGTIGIGFNVHAGPVARVSWPHTRFAPTVFWSRAIALTWIVPPLLLAVLAFDRFDPARTHAAARRRREGSPTASEEAGAPRSAPSHGPAMDALASADARPSFARAVHAEARLVWQTAGWLRWPLLLAAVGAIASPWSAAAFLILLAPVLSELAAREELHGTHALVWAQPSVPRSRVAWKAAAAGLFVLALGAPGLLRAALAGPWHALAWISGLLFVALLAVGTGSLTRGGRLFSAAYTMLWYASVNGRGVDALDYCGIFGGGTSPAVRLAYLAVATFAITLAALVERARDRA